MDYNKTLLAALPLVLIVGGALAHVYERSASTMGADTVTDSLNTGLYPPNESKVTLDRIQQQQREERDPIPRKSPPLAKPSPIM